MLESSRKTRHSPALGGLYSGGKRARAASAVGLGPSWTAGGPHGGAADGGWLACVCPSCVKHKDPSPSFLEFEIMKAGGLREAMDVNKSRQKGHKLSCKQEKIFPHEVISLAQAAWASWGGNVLGPRPVLQPSEGRKTAQENAFPTRYTASGYLLFRYFSLTHTHAPLPPPSPLLPVVLIWNTSTSYAGLLHICTLLVVCISSPPAMGRVRCFQYKEMEVWRLRACCQLPRSFLTDLLFCLEPRCALLFK